MLSCPIMAAMHITVHDSAAGFLTNAGAFLNASEAENNIVSISAARIISAPTRDDADTYLASIEDSGAIVAAALQSSAGVLLTAGPVAALTLFAADMLAVAADDQGIGRWQSYTRNLVEDFRRAFGEEPGRVTAIMVMSDTDNTNSISEALYGDISVAPPRQ